MPLIPTAWAMADVDVASLLESLDSTPNDVSLDACHSRDLREALEYSKPMILTPIRVACLKSKNTEHRPICRPELFELDETLLTTNGLDPAFPI